LCCGGGAESRNKMLDQQDKIEIRTIIKEETLDIRQDVSNLQQDLDKKFNHLGVLMEDRGKTLQIILENLVQKNNKIDQMFGVKDKVDQHEIRMNSLELAVKKKTDLRLI
jgi:hypothetical protein